MKNRLVYWVGMHGTLLFFRKFLRHGTKIAGIVPSSTHLARAAITGIRSDAKVILELGAGTGPITAAIVGRVQSTCRIIAIERDADFVRVLKKRFVTQANLEIVQADISGLRQILKDRGVERVRHVVSGLPIPSFSQELQKTLFRDIHEILAFDGSFNQITEIPLLYRNLYRRYFEEVEFIFELRNIPPAGVYICKRPRLDLSA